LFGRDRYLDNLKDGPRRGGRGVNGVEERRGVRCGGCRVIRP
jgi:hypothetical protein